MIGSASVNASRDFTNSLNRMSRRLLRFGQITTFIMSGVLVKQFAETGTSFERAMSGVQAVTDGTISQFRRLSDQAEELGKVTQFTATESAQAMEKLALAGFNVNEVYKLTPVVLNLAAAGMLNMDEAATIAAGTLRGFGLDIDFFQEAVDVMAYTANRSNQTLRDLGTAFSFVGPVAAAAGVSFNQTNAALAVLANRNLRAERGGTSLRRIIAVLMGDLEEGEAGLAKYNLQLRDSATGALDLADALDTIRAAGVPTFEQFKAFGLRGGPAFISMMEAGSDALRRFEAQLSLAGGTAAEVAQKRLNNLSGDMTKLRSAFQGVALDIFQKFSPALRAMVQGLREFVSGLDPAAIDRIADSIRQVGYSMLWFVGILVGSRVVTLMHSFVDAVINSRMAARAAARPIALLTGNVDNLAAASIKAHRWIGRVSAVGMTAFVGWEVGKLIGELTGLNVEVRKMYDNLIFGAQTAIDEVSVLDATLASVRRRQEQFGNIDIGIEGVDEVLLDDLAAKLEDFNTRVVNQSSALRPPMAVIQTMAEEITRLTGRVMNTQSAFMAVVNEINRIRQEHPQMVAEAFAGVATIGEGYGNLSEKMGAVADEIERMKQLGLDLEEITTKAMERATKALEEAGRFDPEGALKLMALFRGIDEVAGDGADRFVRLSDIVGEFGDEIDAAAKHVVRMGDQADPAFAALISELSTILGLLRFTEDETKANEAAWASLSSAMSDVDLTTSEQLVEFSRELAMMFHLAEQNGVSASNVMQAMAEKIVAMADAGRAANETIPDGIRQYEGWARAIEGVREYEKAEQKLAEEQEKRAKRFIQMWERNWENYRESAIAAFSDTTAQMIVDLDSTTEMWSNLMKSVLKQGISLLIQWGIQRLILSKLTKAATASEHGTQLAGSLAAVYANSFASAAAIPLVGWAMAPGVAAANLAMATGLTAGAAGTGAAMGLGMFAFEHGGIATRPVQGLVGEAGREAILPLDNPQSRNILRDLFPQNMGGPSYNITVEQHFHGDNWAEDGVRPELIDAITKGQSDAIRLGRSLAMPTKVR
jgi:TP901 family phage tail tape measure protein